MTLCAECKKNAANEKHPSRMVGKAIGKIEYLCCGCHQVFVDRLVGDYAKLKAAAAEFQRQMGKGAR